MIELRPYQIDVVDKVEQALGTAARPLLVAPTGSGKTVVAAEIIRRAVAKYRTVLFLAHRREIITQTSAKLATIPLAAVDPKMAARIKRDNEAPHPMGPPLNRPPLTGDATSDWRPTANGAGVSDIPDFLRRRP